MTSIFIFLGFILATSFIVGAAISLYEDNKKKEFLENDKKNEIEIEKAREEILENTRQIKNKENKKTDIDMEII